MPATFGRRHLEEMRWISRDAIHDRYRHGGRSRYRAGHENDPSDSDANPSRGLRHGDGPTATNAARAHHHIRRNGRSV